MERDNALENILDTLAEKSVKAKNHPTRKKYDSTAYILIRELHSDLKKIKYWDDYYSSGKRSIW